MSKNTLILILMGFITLANLANANPERRRPEQRNDFDDFDDFDDLDNHYDGPVSWDWKTHWSERYYGTPSFHLRDDRELNMAIDRTQEKKRRLDHAARELHPLRRELKRKRKRKNDARRDLQNAEKAMERLKNQIQQAQNNVPKLRKQLDEVAQTLKDLEQLKAKELGILKHVQDQIDEMPSKIAAAETRIQQAMQNCQSGGKTSEQCQSDTQVVNAKNFLDSLKKKEVALDKHVQNIQKTLRRVERDTAYYKGEQQRVKQQLGQAQKLVQNGQNQLKQKRKEKQDLKARLERLQSQIKNLKADMRPLQERFRRRERALRQAKRETREIRRNLIDLVLERNSQGYQRGRDQGAQEGTDLAMDLGTEYGGKDGVDEGKTQGTLDGQQREYNKGYAQGEITGENEGKVQGQADGKVLGRKQGNQLAGEREGAVEGIKKAQKSNATTVGQKQGTQDGMERAQADGKRQGEPVGQRQAIEQYEAKDLESTTLNGDFAGTFEGQIPDYPGVDPPNSGQCQRPFRELARMACMDGFEDGYYPQAQAAYHRNIGNMYNSAYNRAYGRAYQQAMNFYYEQSYTTGKQQGNLDKFEQVYPQVKESFRVEIKAKFSANPERQSADFSNAFQAASESSYQQKYDEIRAEAFAKATKQAYQDNIEDQIARSTQARFRQVAAIYKNYPVLRYVRSQISDGGIAGVAANDGVYQPDERILHNITLSNYGHRKASGVVVRSSSGEKVTLPDIPPRSTVTVKGAAISQVKTDVGSAGENKIVLSKVLKSQEPAIEGRHFYDLATGQINAQDIKSFSVSYPLVVSSVSITGDLLLGQETGYRVVVENRSKRPYFGPIEVRMDTSLGQGVLTSALADITHLETQQTLEQGRLLVERENNALQELSFNATLVKNGVVLGQIQGAGPKLVQIQYKDRGDKLVVMGDARQDPNSLLDTLAQWGGVEQVSILDVALDQDALIKSGALAQKTVFLTGQELGERMQTALEQMVQSSTGLAIVLAPYQDYASTLAGLPSMARSVAQTWQIAGIPQEYDQQLTFVNRYVNPQAQLVAVGKSSDFDLSGDIPKIKQLSSAMLKDHQQLIADGLNTLEKELTLEILQNKSIKTKHKSPIQVLLGRIVLDALMIDQVYQSSSKKGKNLIKKMAKDPNDLLNQTLARLKMAMENDDVTKIISGFVLLQELEHQLSRHKVLKEINYRIKRNMTNRFTRRLLGKLDRKLKSKAGGSFYRRFLQDGTNRLRGNFSPIKSE